MIPYLDLSISSIAIRSGYLGPDASQRDRMSMQRKGQERVRGGEVGAVYGERAETELASRPVSVAEIGV